VNGNDAGFVIEETSYEAVKKPGPNKWLIFGIILVVLVFFFGRRRAANKRRRSSPAEPTSELPT